MKVLHFDCFSGISGDMTVAALLDLGIDPEILIQQLSFLNISGYQIKIEKKQKNGITGTDFTVILEEHHHHEDEHHHHHHHQHTTYADIVELIDNSKLNEKVKNISKKLFYIVAKAEGKVHGQPIEQVHFHEVGAVDSIVDIVATAVCIDILDVEEISFSKLPLSTGFVHCQHGLIPLPAPATLEILEDIQCIIMMLGLN